MKNGIVAVLLLLDLFEEYKTKSKYKPSIFYRIILKKQSKVIKSKEYITTTFDGSSIYTAIQIYSSKMKDNRNEYGLIDMLRQVS